MSSQPPPGDAVLAGRLRSQLLAGPPARTPEEVAGRLLAVQAQDLRAARLSVRSRTTGLVASDVDRALERRELVVDWLQRGTLHLVRAEDRAWLHPLFVPGLLAVSARRLAQEGVPPDDAERGVAAVVRALTADGPLVRAALRERVAAAGVRTEGQALVHVLLLTSLRGHVLRGPVVGGEQAFVLVRDWLEPAPPVAREVALARLAERYLAGHAPADDRDLARWSGLPLRDVRAGLGALGDRVQVRPDGLLALAGQDLEGSLPPPRLLGGFEPVLLGWRSRAQIVGPHLRLVTDNGIFRPFALVGGRAVATWRWSGGQVSVTPLEPVDDDHLAALARDGDDVARFLAG